MGDLVVRSGRSVVPKKSWLGEDFPRVLQCPILLSCEYIAKLPNVGRFVCFDGGRLKSHQESVLGRTFEVNLPDKIIVYNEPVVMLFITEYELA